MFDISFTELMVIGVVALIVIGPEKLPKVARTAGIFAGKLQRMVAQVKEEVNREARFEELQQLQREFQGVASTIKSDINNEMQAFKDEAEAIIEPQKVVKKTVRKVVKQDSSENTSNARTAKAKVTSRQSSKKVAAKPLNTDQTIKPPKAKVASVSKKAVS